MKVLPLAEVEQIGSDIEAFKQVGFKRGIPIHYSEQEKTYRQGETHTERLQLQRWADGETRPGLEHLGPPTDPEGVA